jgi:hypothetical protein
MSSPQKMPAHDMSSSKQQQHCNEVAKTMKTALHISASGPGRRESGVLQQRRGQPAPASHRHCARFSSSTAASCELGRKQRSSAILDENGQEIGPDVPRNAGSFPEWRVWEIHPEFAAPCAAGRADHATTAASPASHVQP